MNKAYSEACDRNREPILSVIKPLLSDCRSVLEIGSGTGQHAVYFAARMPHLVWYPSDLAECHGDILQWLEDAGLPNLRPPLSLDAGSSDWPVPEADAVFSANTAHIMSWPAVESMIAGVGALLPDDGRFLLYGPFNYGGDYTSPSNARFDQWLKSRDPDSAIRNFEDIQALAAAAGLELVQDFAMPANNRILYWKKRPAQA